MVTHTKKATHSADYPSWVSKNNAEALAKAITGIVNSILTTGIYPNVRKNAEKNTPQEEQQPTNM